MIRDKIRHAKGTFEPTLVPQSPDRARSGAKPLILDDSAGYPRWNRLVRVIRGTAKAAERRRVGIERRARSLVSNEAGV